MKLKIGSLIEEIASMSNEIFESQTPKEERIYVELKDANRTAPEILNSFKENYTGTLTVVYGENIEETFVGYQLETIRKMYEEFGVQIGIDFVKRNENVEIEGGEAE